MGKVRRRRQHLAGWTLLRMGLYFCLGGVGEPITEGGAPGFIRERRPHCVFLLEQVPEASVQWFGQGWAKLPCHKIIAERISVEFSIKGSSVLQLSPGRGQDFSPRSSPVVNFIISSWTCLLCLCVCSLSLSLSLSLPLSISINLSIPLSGIVIY